MKQTLRLAERGKGKTSPNPMVGAILVKNGEVVGTGYHMKAGEAHAEILALREAGDRARRATLYLNLEPCSHHGKTPPCAPAVIAAGVTRVIVGMEDPNPLVKGKGIDMLKAAGVEVLVGVLEKNCRRLNEAFCKYIVVKEPFVAVKVASTLNGKIATRCGDSKWISSETARRLVHRWRSEVDGIVVGIGTILRDDPLLSTRMVKGRSPFRIVLDSRLRIPDEAQVIRTSPSKTIVVATEGVSTERVVRLEKRGVRVIVVDSHLGRVNLKTCLSRLADLEMVNLMVEGGSQVNGSFLDQGLADKLLLFLSPRLVGDPEALDMFGGVGVESLERAPSLSEVKVKRVGDDLLVEGYVSKGTN